MIDEIKKKVSKKYDLSDKRWVFLSAFDNKGNLISSNWVLFTDKTLSKTLETLRFWIFAEKQKNIMLVAADIVLDYQQETDTQKLLNLDTSIYWLFISNKEKTKSWVLLPNTIWIADTKHWLFVLKQKHPELNWQVMIRSFTTDRITV